MSGAVKKKKKSTPAAASGEKPEAASPLRKLLPGPKYLAGLALAAVVPAIALGGVDHFRDAVRNAVGSDFNFVVSYDNEAGTDYSRVVPASVPADQVQQLLSRSTFFESGGLSSVKVGEQGIKLTIGGERTDRLKIVGMRAVILKTEPATAGTLFHYGAEGEATIQLGFDLASPSPSARIPLKGGGLGEPYFRGMTEPLDTSKAPTFEIVAYPGAHTYTWEIELSLYVEGKAETKRISGPDGPFRVSGYASKYQAAYDLTGDPSDDTPWTAMSPAALCELSNAKCR